MVVLAPRAPGLGRWTQARAHALALGAVLAVPVFFSPPLEAQLPRASQQRVAEPGGTQFNLDFLRPSGGPVIPIFEGWYPMPDGSYALSFGYFNVNTEEVLEIPQGPDNFIEPAIYDGVQPTHFLPVPEGDRRHWGVFTVKVPSDFGDGDVVWSLRHDGRTYSVPGRIRSTQYQINGWVFPGRESSSPVLRLERDGPGSGPGRGDGGGARECHSGRTRAPDRVDAPGRHLPRRPAPHPREVVQAPWARPRQPSASPSPRSRMRRGARRVGPR